jgi:hypothetical protein
VEEPLKADVVDLRVFGEYTIEETAAALSVSTGTVKRHWLSAAPGCSGRYAATGSERSLPALCSKPKQNDHEHIVASAHLLV